MARRTVGFWRVGLGMDLAEGDSGPSRKKKMGLAEENKDVGRGKQKMGRAEVGEEMGRIKAYMGRAEEV